MKKIKVLILKLHKKYYSYEGNEFLKEVVTMENTVYQEVYGVVPEYDHKDYIMSVLRGSLKDTHVIEEFEFNDFEDEDILDFNIKFINSDIVLYHIHNLTASSLIPIIRTIRPDTTSATIFKISGNSVIDLKTGDVKNDFLSFFFNEDDGEVEIKFDYKVRDLNEPILQFKYDGKLDEDLDEAIEAICKKDLNFKYVNIIDDDFDSTISLIEYYRTVKKANKAFEGFIISTTPTGFKNCYHKSKVSFVRINFSKEFAELKLKNYILPKIILDIDLDDEYTIYNVVSWLEEHWRAIKYVNRKIPMGDDSYSKEVFNLLTPILVNIVFGVDPNNSNYEIDDDATEEI